MSNINTITYPSKRFFKNGKRLVWSGEEYEIRLSEEKVVNIIKNGLPFLDEKDSSRLKFIDVCKLFLRTTNFLTLYFYSLGNGYEAGFDLDNSRIIFTKKENEK